MTREDLNSLIEQWENAKVDFKREWSYWNNNMPNNIKEVGKNELVKDIIALTNGDVYSTNKTAYLIIGIDDDTREIYEFDKTAILPLDKLKQQLLTLLNNYAQPEFLALDLELVDDVLVISIPSRGSLISLSKDLKLKNNNTDRKGTTYYRVGEDIRIVSSEVNKDFIKAFNNGDSSTLTKTELEAQRAKEEKLIFSTTPKSKQIYINREVDTLLSNRIAQKKGCVLFLHGQGGMGKSTLLEKFSKTDRPTIFIQINEQIEMSMMSIFLDENKTTAYHCPKFEAKLNEIFIEQKNNKEIPFNAEFELLEAIREDFGEHGVFIVDTFEKNKNSRIRSSVKFSNHTVRFSRTENHQRFRDYLNSLVHLFVSHTTFIIAGRNRIDDVNENRSDEKFLNIDNVEELEMKKFSSSDIEQYIQEYKLESPTQKQLTDIENLTHGNPLILSLLVKVASEYNGWGELNYDEMKKIVHEDEDYGLIYYFTKRILSHVDRVDIWKLIIPRVLTKEIEPLLFEEKKIFKLLVDVGLLYREKGKERNIYTLHDDVAMAIKSYAQKELDRLSLASWHDNDDVIGLHRVLMEFYENHDALYRVNSTFEACYHKMMLKQDFERDFEVTREEFVGFILGSLILSLKKKMDICTNWKNIQKSEVSQYIKDLKDEKDKNNITKELYNKFSRDLAFGVVDSLYDTDYLLKLSKSTIFENDWSVFYILGLAYGDKQENDKAIEAYQKVIEINSKKDEGYLGLSKIYVDYLNQTDKGIYFINKAIEVNPNNDIAYQHMGVAYSKKKEYDKVIEAYQNILKIKPNDDEVYNNLGIAYGKNKEYDKALEAFIKAIEINPKNYGPYCNIGIFYEKKEEYDKAIEAYTRVIEINPTMDDIYLRLSKIYVDFLNQIDKGIYCINKAIEINPNNDISYQHMVIAYGKKKEYDKVIEAYQKIVEIKPDDKVYFNMGNIYSERQEYQKAIKVYKKAIEINPKNHDIYLKLSKIYIDFLSESEKGILFANKAIEINPKNSIAYQHMAIAYHNKEEYDNVIEAYQKILEINPEDDKTYYNIGNTYGKKKEYSKAIEAYKSAIELNPNNARLYYSMGFTYLKQKEPEKMIEAWKKSFELNPKIFNWWGRFILWLYRKVG